MPPSVTDAASVMRRLAAKLGVPALPMCDVGTEPASVASAPAIVLTGDDPSPAALARWTSAGYAVAWHGRTSGTPSAVAVVRPEDDVRASALLAGGPHGLALDPVVDVLSAPVDLAGVRVAIVTFELVGLTRTGGIGTAYTALAHALAQAGAHVDALFTGWPAPGADLDAAIADYEAAGVHVHRLDVGAVERVRAESEHLRRADVALRWLRARHEAEPYDVVHLPECAGHGALIAAAKRAGEAFAQATIVTGTHGSSRWVREINGEPFTAPDQLTIETLERRCVEDADAVVSPSAYLVGDMQARGWRLPERTFVQQYVVPPAAADGAAPAGGAVRELVFFGRLETRKGLLLFLDALDRLAQRVPADALRVTFLGRPDFIGERRADAIVAERREAWPWDVTLLTDLDQPAALDYLRGEHRLAVMPSLADNLPLTVLEGLALGIPFVTCATGGIPEMIDADDLPRCACEPDPDALAQLLERAIGAEPLVPRFAVDVAANRDAHLRWHAALATAGRTATSSAPAPVAEPSVVELGAVDGLPDDPNAYVLLRSPRHQLDAGAGERLVRAAQAAGADAVTFATRTADGDVVHPVGGPPALAPVASVMGNGSALVRRELLQRPPADERELELLLAGACVAGERLLVLPDAVGTEAGDDGPDGRWLLGWWPTPDEMVRADERRALLEPALPTDLRDLPVVATLVSQQLGAERARAEETRAVAERMTGQWKEARDVLARRDEELAETIAWAREMQEQLIAEQKRLRGLQSRRAVRIALRIAGLKQKVRRG